MWKANIPETTIRKGVILLSVILAILLIWLSLRPVLISSMLILFEFFRLILHLAFSFPPILLTRFHSLLTLFDYRLLSFFVDQNPE